MANSPLKFSFRNGETVRMPFTFKTVNPDNTRTPINLTGKRITLEFWERGKSVEILKLDSSQSVNLFGAKIEVINAVGGHFEVLIPALQIAQLPKVVGEYLLWLHESNGDSRVLAKGLFVKK